MKSATSTEGNKKKYPRRMKPYTAWILDCGWGYMSCLTHDEAHVRKEIKCAKACKEPIPRFRKVRITEIR